MRNFRVLRANEIECRIAEIAKNGGSLSLLLYKTARTDAALLDETVGMFNWQTDYKMLDGKLYCGIGVKSGDSWIWKWNVGTESNMEAEKGQASDAFKRAGFTWGVGAELYSSPQIKIWSDKCNIKDYNGKYKCYDKFSVQAIEYDANEDISKLVIVNETSGAVCFVWEAGAKPQPNTTAPANTAPPVRIPKDARPDINAEPEIYTPTCVGCGAEISDRVHDFSVKKYKKPLCMECQRKQGAAS